MLIVLTAGITAVSAAESHDKIAIDDAVSSSDAVLDMELNEDDSDMLSEETDNGCIKLNEYDSDMLSEETDNGCIKLNEYDSDMSSHENNDTGLLSENYLLSGTEDDNDSEEDEIQKNDSRISSNANKFYYGSYFQITLKDNSSNVVKNGAVIFNLNGKNYTSNTDKNGVARLNVKLSPGTYSIKVSYGGSEELNPQTKTFSVTVLKNVPKIQKVTNCVFRGKYFYVYLKNATGSAMKNYLLYLKIGKKTYKKYTNSKGRVKLKFTTKTYLNKLKVIFKGKGDYSAVSRTITVRVKINPSNKNSIWVWARDMNNVPLSTLKKNGIKNIFIHETAIYRSGFYSWLKKANNKGLKVHIWMQCFYNGKTWPRICSKSSVINTTLQKQLIKKAKKYAGIKGVSGVHLDYIRFGATAPKYKKAEDIITITVKKLTYAIKSKNKNCIVSCSVMGDGVKSNVYYYGQNLTRMSEYVDVIVPMAYKGNYHQKRTWIRDLSSSYKKAISGKAKLWVGLQAYRSDDDIRKWSKSALTKDIKYAFKGGADGIVLFRYGLTRYVDIVKIKKSMK